MMVGTHNYAIESVLKTLYKKKELWSCDTCLTKIFKSSEEDLVENIQYINTTTQEPLCQQYMLPYTSLIMAINQTIMTE